MYKSKETRKAITPNLPYKRMKTMTEKPTLSTEHQASKQDAVHAISQWLTEGDELDRCCACRSLGALGDQHSVDILVAHLRDDDTDVCIDAAEALGHIGDTRAVTPLLESLHNDPDGDVKTMVVEALGRLGGEQAISQLIELAISPPEDDEWDDDEAWDSNWDIQIGAVQALGRLRVTKAVTPLSKLLDDDECQVDKSDIYNALARIGGLGEQILIQHLQENTPRERRRAAHSLGITCSPVGARALGRALQDPEPDVRMAAIDAVVRGKHEHYLGALLLLLRDPSDEVRETALNALNKLTLDSATKQGPPIELEKLLPLLDDNSPQVQAVVLNTLHSRLTEIADEPTQARIRNLLEHPNPLVAAAACSCSITLKDEQTEHTLLSLVASPQTDSAVRQQAILALGQRENASETVLGILTDALYTQDSIIIFSSLQALLALHHQQHNKGGRSSSDSSDEIKNQNEMDEKFSRPLQIILSALRGEIISPLEAEPQIEEAATTTEALTELHEPVTPVELNNVAPSSTLDAIALANVELARELETNKPLNTDEIPELATEEMHAFQAYYEILEQQKYDQKKFKRNKTIDVGDEVRRLSARILGECSHPEVVTALAQAIHDENPEIQREAIDALSRIAAHTQGITETLGPLTSFLHLGNFDLRAVSARALGALGNLDTLPSLLDCLEDENLLVRNQAVLAVGRLLKSYTINSLTKKNTLSVVKLPVVKKEADKIDCALHCLVCRLEDTDVGVRKAAAQMISRLDLLISSDEIRSKIIEHLINAGCCGESGQPRDMGIALRTLDPAKASNHLINHLNTLPSSIERRLAIEMLEEIFRPHQAA